MKSRPRFMLIAFTLFFSIAALQVYWILAASTSGWAVVIRFNDVGEGWIEVGLALLCLAVSLIGIGIFTREVGHPTV